MNNIRINCFFCEDVRLDNEGKPMLIGVLAPVAWFDEPRITIDQLKYMSIFYVPRSVNEFQAALNLAAEGEVSGLGEGQRKFNLTFLRPKDLENDEEEWMAMSHLPLRDLTFSDKSRLRATLRVGDQVVQSSLQIRHAGAGGHTSGNANGPEAPSDGDSHSTGGS